MVRSFLKPRIILDVQAHTFWQLYFAQLFETGSEKNKKNRRLMEKKKILNPLLHCDAIVISPELSFDIPSIYESIFFYE